MNKTQLGTLTRTAGISYILVILIGVIKVNFLETAALNPADNIHSIHDLIDERLLRVGIAAEVIMFILVILLSLSLFFILKKVHEGLATAALIFRLGEAIIGCTVVMISGIVPLLILNSEPAIDSQQTFAVIELLISTRVSGLNIVLIFVGIGGALFFHLFLRSLLIPRFLAAWGIFTYLSMLLLGFLNLLIQDLPNFIEMFLFSLGGIFEATIGFWLLFKGVKFEIWQDINAKPNH